VVEKKKEESAVLPVDDSKEPTNKAGKPNENSDATSSPTLRNSTPPITPAATPMVAQGKYRGKQPENSDTDNVIQEPTDMIIEEVRSDKEELPQQQLQPKKVIDIVEDIPPVNTPIVIKKWVRTNQCHAGSIVKLIYTNIGEFSVKFHMDED
jgi:hypothetical protein